MVLSSWPEYKMMNKFKKNLQTFVLHTAVNGGYMTRFRAAGLARCGKQLGDGHGLLFRSAYTPLCGK